jgi:phosphomannomutase
LPRSFEVQGRGEGKGRFIACRRPSSEAREVITVDGIRAVFDKDGDLSVRRTQPVLVMRFEANDPTILESIKTMMEEIVNMILSDLKSS